MRTIRPRHDGFRNFARLSHFAMDVTLNSGGRLLLLPRPVLRERVGVRVNSDVYMTVRDYALPKTV